MKQIMVGNQQYKSGCYGDGTFGLSHVNLRVCEIADEILGTIFMQEYRASSDPEWQDGVIEEALAALNQVTKGGIWEFEGGDLVLLSLD